MILDTIKQLHRDYGHYTIKQCIDLGFNPRMEDVPLWKQFLRREGKWCCLGYSIVNDLEWMGAMRIMPDMPGSQWPVYDVFEDGGKFNSSSLLTSLLYNHIGRLNEHKNLAKKHLADWDNVYATILPVYRLFGGTDNLDEIKEIVFDKRKWAGADQDRYNLLDKYRDFCLKHDPGYGC